MRIVTPGISWTYVQTPRRLSTAFKAIWLAVTVGSWVAGALEIPLFGALLGGLGLLTWALPVASFVLSQQSKWAEGTVDVTETALLVRPISGQERVVDRASIVGALVVERPVPGALAYSVEVETTGGDRLTIRMTDGETARALVDRLGFGAGGACVRSRLTTPGRRFVHLPLAFGIYVFLSGFTTVLASILFGFFAGGLFGVAAHAATLLAFILLKRLIAPPEVVIGDDGVRVERGYGARFFRVNDPRLFSAVRGFGLDDLRVASVLRRAEERSASGAVAATAPGAFARGDRSLEDWRQWLKAMAEGGYRASPKTAEEAASVLRSPAATPDERIGAAMALRVAGETERVRAAAAATAEVRVRIALEAVADEQDDAAIEKALRRMAVR